MKKLKKWQIVLIVILALGVIGVWQAEAATKKKEQSRQLKKPLRRKTERRREDIRHQGYAEGW